MVDILAVFCTQMKRLGTCALGFVYIESTYVYMCVLIYVCVYKCVSVYTHTHTHTHTHVSKSSVVFPKEKHCPLSS